MLSKYYATLVNFVKKYSCDMDGIYLGISFFLFMLTSSQSHEEAHEIYSREST